MSIEAKRTAAIKNHSVEHMELIRAGKTEAMERRKEQFLAGYDVKLSLYKNAVKYGVEYTTVRRWCNDDESFFRQILNKEQDYKKAVVEGIEQVAIKAAKGEFFCRTTYKNPDGSVKQTAEYQQQPSYKHAELLLRALDPETYKPENAGGVAININLSHVDGSGNVIDANAIDVSDDPGALEPGDIGMIDLF